jgi:hypothetical protein
MILKIRKVMPQWWHTLINKSKYPLDSGSDIGVYLKIQKQNTLLSQSISMKPQE